MDLNRGGTHGFGRFRGKELGHRGLLQTGAPRLAQRCRMQNHLPRRLDPGGHIREAEGHGLMLDDGFAEGHPLARIVAGSLEGRAGHADGLRGDADAPALKVRQRDLVALTFLAQTVLDRHAHVGEGERAGVRTMLAELVLDRDDLVAGGVGRHDKGGDAALAGVRVGHREKDDDIAVLARGDELLRAVDDVVIAIAARAGLERRGVRSGLRFGQGEAADPLARRHLRQEALFLRLGAKAQDRRAADRAVDREDCRAGPVARRHFLKRQRIGHRAQIRAAIALGHQHPQKAQLAHLAQFRTREGVVTVALGRAGRQPLGGEGAHHVAHLLLRFGQQHQDTRSIAMAVASPPPMQSDATPRESP